MDKIDKFASIYAGVPQGSMLGVLLFAINTTSLVLVVFFLVIPTYQSI